MKKNKPTTRDPYVTNKLSLWIQTCPHCRQVWVIGDIAEHESYCCKECKHEFRISREYVPAQFARAA